MLKFSESIYNLYFDLLQVTDELDLILVIKLVLEASGAPFQKIWKENN